MRKERLQQIATKFFNEAIAIAKTKKQRIICTNTNSGYVKLVRVLKLLKLSNIEANFESFLDFRRKQTISFKG